MADFTTIPEAKKAGKGNIAARVVKVGELVTGKSDRGAWQKRVFNIADKKDSVEFVAWADEINILEINETYEFVNCWWKEYNGIISLQKSKFGKVVKIAKSNSPPKENADDPTVYTTPAAAAAPEETSDESEYTGKQVMEIIALVHKYKVIEKIVEGELTEKSDHGETPILPNPAKVGMYMKLISDDMKDNAILKIKEDGICP